MWSSGGALPLNVLASNVVVPLQWIYWVGENWACAPGPCLGTKKYHNIYIRCINILQTVANLTHSQKSLKFYFIKSWFSFPLFSYYEQ